MNLQEYHDRVWLPFSSKIDEKVKAYKILRMLKKLFDVHFTILALLGISATPKEDVDCYWYICKRAKDRKYKELSWKKRFKVIKELFRQAWKS